MPQSRDKAGRFVKGVSGNPGGRPPRPKELQDYAKKAPKELKTIADDPETPLKVKAEIYRWFYEVVYGKPAQAVELETPKPIEIRAMDLSKLTDEELIALADEADE